MQLEYTILDDDRDAPDDLDVTIGDDRIVIDYDDGGGCHRITLSHDQFKQIWRLLAHFNQIQEAESCNK